MKEEKSSNFMAEGPFGVERPLVSSDVVLVLTTPFGLDEKQLTEIEAVIRRDTGKRLDVERKKRNTFDVIFPGETTINELQTVLNSVEASPPFQGTQNEIMEHRVMAQ